MYLLELFQRIAVPVSIQLIEKIGGAEKREGAVANGRMVSEGE